MQTYSKLTIYFLFLVTTMYAQKVRVIDNKGTVIKFVKPTIVELYTDGDDGTIMAGSFVDIVFSNTGTRDEDGYTVSSSSSSSSSVNIITVAITGTYKVTYRVTGELYDGESRCGTEYVLQKKVNNAIGFNDVEGSVSAAYHRSFEASKNTATATRILELEENDQLKVRGKRYAGSRNIRTVANGSSFLIERIK